MDGSKKTGRLVRINTGQRVSEYFHKGQPYSADVMFNFAGKINFCAILFAKYRETSPALWEHCGRDVTYYETIAALPESVSRDTVGV